MQKIEQRIAVKALILNDRGQVLILRKGQDDLRHAGKSGRYNLPGGKMNPGETIDEALVREVREEVGITIVERSQAPIFVGEWRPVVNGVPHQIVGMFFTCKHWSGTIVLNSEHDAYLWISEDSIDSYNLLPPEGDVLKTYFDASHA